MAERLQTQNFFFRNSTI